MVDVCVVGAGPAGLGAAAAANAGGASVVMLDAGVRAGGQFWRHGPSGPDADLHHGLDEFAALRRSLGRVDHRPEHRVWAISADGDLMSVHATHRGAPVTVRAARLVLAPGAYDRQLPFPGWTLPGVITAGAAQALLKQHGVPAGRHVLVAGTGPFLLPVATGLAARGVDVVAVAEANSTSRWRSHLRAIDRAHVIEAAGYAARLARHRIPVRERTVVLAAHGDDALSSVTTARLARDGSVRPGTEREVPVDTLAVGWGFTASLELPVAAGCALTLGADGEAYARVDGDQRSSNPSVFVAGEATGVGGAQLAVAEGRIAGAAAAADTAGRAAPALPDERREVARLRRFADAVAAVYPVPPHWAGRLAGTTLVCRCEEVPAARVQEAADLGARDLRSAKLLSRAGMGWCQGRVCGYATGCLVAARTGVPRDPTQGHERPITDPVTLRTVAAAQLSDPEGEP